MTIYQAGPLFSDAERTWHKTAKAELEAAGFSVVWPGDLLTQERIIAAGAQAPSLIFSVCKEALEGCGCVVALLDGSHVDDGTAWEIGFAYAKGIPVYGIRTDFRSAGETSHNRVNAMIEGSLAGFGKSIAEVITMLKKV